MADLPDELRTALATRLAAEPVDRMRSAVARLIDAYRSGRRAATPILAGPTEIAAYAAYRMPATYAAVRAAIGALLPTLPAPTSLADVGGGTGAAAWAVADAFPPIERITVVDQVDDALALGATLAASASAPAMRSATWQRSLLPAELPSADLITISYVLGELAEAAQHDLVAHAANAAAASAAAGRAGRAGVVVIVEPGTPAGYARVIAARDQLLALGHRVLAPCPHQLTCPLAAGDWCHFAARVNRTALHRRIKDADLSYEDEKFSYVATASPRDGLEALPAGDGRVIRRPTQRKGLVTLRLCRPDGTAGDRIVTKRHGDLYRQARDTHWGDAFPA
ncbi:MAG TPA: small ribosomal subunit Rsm22 family protein [Micromonosporaceae bacterium]|nr:small ribosomal subunit Rsm22 family protein [Micromonosporaceae bacterium]